MHPAAKKFDWECLLINFKSKNRTLSLLKNEHVSVAHIKIVISISILS